MKLGKSKIAILLATLLVGNAIGVYGVTTIQKINATLKPVQVKLNNEDVLQGVKCVEYNGTTYVPLRSFSSTLDTTVDYKGGVIYMENEETVAESIVTPIPTTTQEPVATPIPTEAPVVTQAPTQAPVQTVAPIVTPSGVDIKDGVQVDSKYQKYVDAIAKNYKKSVSSASTPKDDLKVVKVVEHDAKNVFITITFTNHFQGKDHLVKQEYWCTSNVVINRGSQKEYPGE